MDDKNKFLLFLYSTPNIIGLLLGILGVIIFFVLAFFLESVLMTFILLATIPAFYLIGLLLTPRSPTYELRFYQEATVEEIEEELENLTKTIQGKVSLEVMKKVESLKKSILDILPHIADITSSEHNIYIIRQTALDYLPETLENYINLPTAYANLHPVKDGKTAKQILLEQLTLLDEQMKEVVEDFHRNDTERLLAHSRFLEDKFGEADILAH